MDEKEALRLYRISDTSEEDAFQKVKSGEWSREDFLYWSSEQRDRAYSDGQYNMQECHHEK